MRKRCPSVLKTKCGKTHVQQTPPSLSRQELLDRAERGQLVLRDMRSADLNQVVQIEFNAQLSPWGRISFEESLTRQHTCRVLLLGEKVVAYHVVCAIADELHVLNVVAALQLQGLGLGHRLMQDIVEITEAQRLAKIFLEVRASNHVAQNLYAQWQFNQIAIRKQYYRPNKDGLREDALIFVRTMGNQIRIPG